MRRTKRGPVWARLMGAGRIGVGLAMLCVTAPAAAAPPIEAYGALPGIDLIALSPDGSKVASAVTQGTVRQVQVRNVADAALVAAYPTDKAKIRAISWGGDHHLLVLSSQTADVNGLAEARYESAIVSDLNLVTGKTAILMNGGANGVVRVGTALSGPIMVRTIDGHPVAFVTTLAAQSGRIGQTLFRIDLETQAPHAVIGGDPQTAQWLVDDDGVPAARVQYSAYNDAFGYHARWALWTRKGSSFVKGFEDNQPIDVARMIGFGRTPGTVMIRVRDGDDWSYREVAIGTDTVSPPIPALVGAEPVIDPKTRLVIGTQRQNGMRIDYNFFAEPDRQLWRAVVRAFPDAVIRIESWSDDRRRVILRVEGKAAGVAYYLLDATTRKATWLADRYAGIAADDLGEARAISYTASDGFEVLAFLTLPPGGPTTGLPLVVLPHGGPQARDDAGFDWWAQALASRGYAVLQPQFRGSTGFGERYHTAGYGEWGRKMQTDLSDGVAFLAANKTIDPKRVAIVGASYGGYAALAGVTLQTGIYRCAVSLAGVTDLRAMLAYDQHRTAQWESPALRYQERYMGVKSRSDPALDALSPVTFADKVTVPVLLIHGADDTVVPYAQSKTMAEALAKAGHPATLITLPGEDHWLSRGETRAAMLRATVDFLATNLPASGGAAGPATGAP